jgi:two-component system chemotaxis sensor kinase CheA
MAAMEGNDTRSEFVFEARDHLADMENELLAIEAGGAAANPKLVEKVFRAIHSIKGGAGFLELTTLSQLAHHAESVLSLIGNRQLVPDAPVTEALLKSIDRIRDMIDDIDHSNLVDVSDCVTALHAITTTRRSVATSSGDAPRAVPQAAAARAAAEPTTAQPRVVAQPSKKARPGERTASPKPGDSSDLTIRVEVNVLDRLMNLASELVLTRNELLQSMSQSVQTGSNSPAARLNHVTTQIQDAVMQTRLQPLATVFGRFPRIVRDLGLALGKQCRLVLEGQEVELDKSIAEAIGDPLTHLVRNAIDHGIEPPDARVHAGKPPAGTITLRGSHHAGRAVVSISDDGRGIDAAKLREKAIARGLIDSDQARTMSDREALRWIFRPGFSTAEKVTEISGRGVGMDVVKANVEKLGGTVAVETQPGNGTTITLTLPLTVAIVPALVVRCGACRFALPHRSIRELVRVSASDAPKAISRVDNVEVLRLRGSLLPLVRLGQSLGLALDPQPSGPPQGANIVVVEAGPLRYGLVVDALCDSLEIVVKPLSRHLRKCRVFSGATVLGDGGVAMILDVVGIAAACQLVPSKNEELPDALSTAHDPLEETQWLLLFRNAPDEYFGVPTDAIQRVERVRADQIDTVGGLQVLQYRGMSLPLVELEGLVAARPRAKAPRVYVTVFQAGQNEVGLLMAHLVDIREMPARVDTITFREPGILGSLVSSDGMTIRVLDLNELAYKARPGWFSSSSTRCDRLEEPATMLVAEGSVAGCRSAIGEGDR